MRFLALLLLALGISTAFAADNALIVTPGVGVTMRTIDDGSAHQIGTSVPVGVNGASAWGTAGTANANTLTVQGIASMTPFLTTTTLTGTVPLPTGAATLAKQPALGTAGAASVDVLTVQGIASMTPFLANPGTASLWGVNTLGSSTSGQSGQLALGAITTAAPTYVNGQSNALSLDTAGNLRVSGGGGGPVTMVSGAVASGAYSSGAFASGSVASGAFASGSLASGSVASGAMVDLGAQADAACGSDNGSCSLIALVKRNNQNVASPATLSAATTGGCTGQLIQSSATAIFTQVKASAGTLCWIRYVQTTTTALQIRVYDSAVNGNVVCGSASNLLSQDLAQSNATSPGMVGNLGPFGEAHANGIGICITGGTSTSDNTTSAVTGLNLNIGFK